MENLQTLFEDMVWDLLLGQESVVGGRSPGQRNNLIGVELTTCAHVFTDMLFGVHLFVRMCASAPIMVDQTLL